MNFNPEPLILNTGHLAAPDLTKDPWENRAALYQMYDAPGVPRCTIAVTAYNRLHQTKYCVQCILNNTREIDFELLLIDNGSDDGTLEFFQSVAHGRKKIVRVTKNIGFCYAWHVAKDCFSGKYLVIVSNDVYVTKNWLTNLLTCYESDPRIGFVEPVSSNVSNYQQVDLPYQDFEDMQRKAAAYNQSDPLKWDERLRCISLVGVYSRPVLDIIGLSDAAFAHAFIEDDLAQRLRRNGYKLMLCRDTWVCHDHDVTNISPREWEVMSYGRSVYREKYHGLDAWDDVLNMEFELLHPLSLHPFEMKPLTILVAEGRCGTPVLEVRNHLHRRGLPKAEIHAFTTRAKYFADLQAVADTVQCGCIERLYTYYADEMFDVAVLCEPSNVYLSPADIVSMLRSLLKPGGLLLYKVLEADGVSERVRQVIKGEEGALSPDGVSEDTIQAVKAEEGASPADSVSEGTIQAVKSQADTSDREAQAPQED